MGKDALLSLPTRGVPLLQVVPYSAVRHKYGLAHREDGVTQQVLSQPQPQTTCLGTVPDTHIRGTALPTAQDVREAEIEGTGSEDVHGHLAYSNEASTI
jgi:hypothetical protein